MINNLHHCRLKICTYDCFQRIWEVSNFKISIRVDPRWSGFQVPSVWVPVLDKGWMMGVRVIDHVSQMTCCHRIILELPPPYPPEKDDEQHNNKQAPKKTTLCGGFKAIYSAMTSSFFEHTFGMIRLETSKIFTF